MLKLVMVVVGNGRGDHAVVDVEDTKAGNDNTLCRETGRTCAEGREDKVVVVVVDSKRDRMGGKRRVGLG
jgi:hypothetical protein